MSAELTASPVSVQPKKRGGAKVVLDRGAFSRLLAELAPPAKHCQEGCGLRIARRLVSDGARR